ALTRFDFTTGANRGSQLMLYPRCLVHRSASQLETVPLSRVTAIKVSFKRDARRVGWGIACVFTALLLLAVSSSLGSFAHGAAQEMTASYRDLREFIAQLEAKGELKRIRASVSPRLEMTEICDRVLRAGGPALVFERPSGHEMPVLANLFGTVSRVAAAMGAKDASELREVGKLLAYLKEPEPPKGLRDLWDKFPVFKRVLDMAPKELSSPSCQEIVWQGADVDLGRLPVQTCWPQDAGPLITWGLTVTRGPRKSRQNLGIYRQQVIAPNRLIMRWLAHRGGALDFRDHAAVSKDPFPVAVALGADPATMLAAVTPIPDTLGEYQFAGLLRGARTELAKCIGSDLQVPATAEIVLEGAIGPGETAAEGPHGDHTGYYNEAERFPVFTIDRITMRR